MLDTMSGEVARICVLISDFAEKIHHTSGNFSEQRHQISSVRSRDN